jgi:hypothetical protein
MTAMSEPRRLTNPEIGDKPATFRGGSSVVHRVHESMASVRLLGFLLIPFAGCVLPPTLSVDTSDGGVNSPPAIIAVRSDEQELPEPGPVNFETGINAGTMAISLIDTDVDDDLYVRLFVNYTVAQPTSPRSTCETAPTGTTQRTATCTLRALCLAEDVGNTTPLFLTVQVFDRKVDDLQAPPFKAMPEGGLTTSRSYFLNCQDPS